MLESHGNNACYTSVDSMLVKDGVSAYDTDDDATCGVIAIKDCDAIRLLLLFKT